MPAKLKVVPPPKSLPAKRRKRKLQIVGDEGMGKLSDVKPNSWNPNKVTPSMLSSIRHGLIEDGWIKSQKLLIWRTDEKGTVMNIIIDGEHRWKVGTELALEEAPMVWLDGLTEEQAKKLTVKFIMKHGDPELNELTALLKSFEIGDLGEASLDLGFDTDFLQRALGSTGTDFLGQPNGGDAAGSKGNGNVTPEGYQLVFAFAKAADKDRVLEIIDAQNKPTRSAALLALCEKSGFKS